MVVHVGLSPSGGLLSYFNELEKSSINSHIYSVSMKEINKIPLLFSDMKSKVSGNLGNLCIYLMEYHDYELRKKYITCGLKNGFKNVEIINWETLIYLNTMSQIEYKPLNGNVIWIKWHKNIYLWEMNDQKAKYIGEWPVASTAQNVLEKIVLDINDFDPHQEGIISISQEEFRKMSEPLLNKVKNTVNAALHNSRLNENLIYKVLLVGGGSRMPMIKQLLKDIFPNSEHCCEEHPDEVVAIGAAYYAYSIFSEL